MGKPHCTGPHTVNWRVILLWHKSIVINSMKINNYVNGFQPLQYYYNSSGLEFKACCYVVWLNLLKPSGNFPYDQVQH
jgi:hypothetical protein